MWRSSCSLLSRARSPRRWESARARNRVSAESADLLLAGRAEKARALALACYAYRGPADAARQRGAVVDVVVLLEIARGAVRVHEVAQARPAGGERGEKRVPHGRNQSLAAREREAPGARARMDARP